MKTRRKLPTAIDLRREMAQHVSHGALPVAWLDGILYRVVGVEAFVNTVVPGFKNPKDVVNFKLEKF